MITNPRLRSIIDKALDQFQSSKLTDNWKDFGQAKLRIVNGKFIRSLYELIKPVYSLELGSGASTQLMAECVSVRHYAYEHHNEYFNETVANLVKSNLIHKTAVYLRPLNERYMYPVFKEDMPLDSIDLVLIDGPPLRKPKDGVRRDRSMTLPDLLPYLKSTAIVLLDNTDRESETQCMIEWKEEYCIEYETHSEIPGMGIISPFGA